MISNLAFCKRYADTLARTSALTGPEKEQRLPSRAIFLAGVCEGGGRKLLPTGSPAEVHASASAHRAASKTHAYGSVDRQSIRRLESATHANSILTLEGPDIDGGAKRLAVVNCRHRQRQTQRNAFVGLLHLVEYIDLAEHGAVFGFPAGLTRIDIHAGFSAWDVEKAGTIPVADSYIFNWLSRDRLHKSRCRHNSEDGKHTHFIEPQMF